MVSHTDRGGRTRIISARPLTSAERHDYEESESRFDPHGSPSPIRRIKPQTSLAKDSTRNHRICIQATEPLGDPFCIYSPELVNSNETRAILKAAGDPPRVSLSTFRH